MVIKVDNVMNLRKFEDLNIDRFKNTRAFLKIKMDVIIFVLIVLFLMLEEECVQDKKKVC